MVFQFDNQKFGYVCFVQPGKNTHAEVIADSAKKATDPYQERTDEVVGYLSNLNSKQQFGVFCLYSIAEVGQDFLIFVGNLNFLPLS